VKLREYQADCICRLIELGRAYLLADMGAGKTVIALTAASRVIDEARPFLVIAPKLVALTGWHSEVARWPHLHHLSLTIISGTPKQRLEKLRPPYDDIYVINYELVPWLAENVNICKLFKGLICDEISRLKSPNKARWRGVKRLADSTRFVWGLTGTPLSTSYMDLFGQFRIVDKGHSLGAFITHYRIKYFYPRDVHGWRWDLKMGAADQIIKAIDPIVVRVTGKDQLKESRIYTNAINVDLDQGSETKYRQLVKEFITTLPSDTVVVAENAATLTGKLSQFTGGGMYNEDKTYEVIHEHKYNALDEVLEELTGQPAIIIYAYKGEAETIRERTPDCFWLGREGCPPENLIEMWNKGQVKGMRMLLHPASAGHGLNLQRGGHHIIWYGGTWSQEMYRQTNARLARFGQRHPVTVHHLICPRTIDAIQYRMLQGRMEAHDNLLTALT